MPLRLTVPPLAAVILAGCTATGPLSDRQPPVEIPGSWQTGTGAGPVETWLGTFGDAALSRAVEEALTGNFGLRSAADRVRAAGARARIAGAAPGPRAEVTGSASRSDRSRSSGNTFAAASEKRYELSGQLSWEADLWNRLSDSARAARAESEATESDYQAARLSLAANIARQWFNLVEARAQTRLARNTVDSFEQSLETTENRYRQGIGEALDVRLARNNLATARANLAQRQREQRNLGRGLEVLLGRYPAGRMGLPDILPRIEQPVPAGLPAQLLERRPDLIASESRLRAAGYRLSNAEKNRLPAISLTAQGGTSSDSLRNVVDMDFFFWTIAANLAQPIFQGGRLAAERELARAQDSEALNDYAQAALNAFKEVEDALDSEDFLVSQETATRTAAEEARAAEKLALDQYRRGLTGIVTLLESQRRKFNADSALIAVTNQRLQNRIALHLALGGDFEDPNRRRAALVE